MFSVLMTIYKNDNVEHLRDAILSVYNQTVKPGEILIVKDGPLKDETEKMLSEFRDPIFNFVQLKKNVGQSEALRRGILKCKYDLVARMDADDISAPDRFKIQLEEFEKDSSIDVLGTGISEFSKDIKEVEQKERVLPLSHEEIIKYSKFRCPVNHATVMFRKSKVIEAGNYFDIYSVADYHLWPRMFKVGARFKNISKPLMYVRGGTDMYARRGGLYYALQDLKLQLYFLKIRHINFFQFILNLAIRIPVGLSPNFLRTFLYNKVLRKTSVDNT